VKIIKNFNLIVSTSRLNESNAKTELWFSLLMCGDKYPIISNLEYSGLISAFTILDVKQVIKKISNILKQDPNFFQYILKIIPIDFICEKNIQIISKFIKEHYQDYLKKDDTFKIELKRRKSDKIERNEFIEKIAENIDNKVNLDNPDVIIRFELLGNICGISFLNSGDILKIKNRYNQY